MLTLVCATVLGACASSGVEATSTTTSLVVSSSSTTSDNQATTTSPPATTSSTTGGSTTEGVSVGGKIGVVGCSNTAMAVSGYTRQSSLDLLTEGGLTGGSLAVWGNEGPGRYDRYWGLYDDRRPADGYSGAWFQMCIRDTEHQGAFDAAEQMWIQHVVGEIRERDGDIPIWISGVNFYADGVVCPTIGPDGDDIAAEAADWAAANIAGVSRAPDIGPIEAGDLAPGEQCHISAAAEDKVGLQLVAFFDGG